MWAFVVAYRHWAAVQLLCGSAHGTLFHRPEEHGTEERGQKVCMYAFFKTFWTMNFFMNIRTYVCMHVRLHSEKIFSIPAAIFVAVLILWHIPG